MIAESNMSNATTKYSRYKRVTCITKPDRVIDVQKTPPPEVDISRKMSPYRTASLLNEGIQHIATLPPISNMDITTSPATRICNSPPSEIINPKEEENIHLYRKPMERTATSNSNSNSKNNYNNYESSFSRVSSRTSSPSQVPMKSKNVQGLHSQADVVQMTTNMNSSSHNQNNYAHVNPINKQTNPSAPNTPSSSTTLTRSPDSLRKPGIEQGGGGVVPQIDAPKSAVNASNRHVLVRFNKTSINIPVTPETTSVDLIQAFAEILQKKFTSSSVTLFESFSSHGLRRRIRRYEHIRDVMNSWDQDTQNGLTIESALENDENDLASAYAPKEAPCDMTVLMYHSPKPRKWNKRYVTLLSTGQIYISKHAGSKVTDKESQNICHLSDFDIYSPISQKAFKDLSPPGRKCYAIKSQQKQTMFLSNDNYIHYLSSIDDNVGEKFHSTVQRWRSWFLVNRLGNDNLMPQYNTGSPRLVRKESPKLKQEKPAFDKNSNILRSSQPLIDMCFSKNEMPDKDFFSLGTLIEGRPPQTSRKQTNSRQNSSKSNQASSDDSDEFLSSSLLGKTYIERKRQLGEKIEQKRNQTPNNQTNKMQNQKCLLDFTSAPIEPPQWSRSGKGHGIMPVEGVPLVEIATSKFLLSDSKSVFQDNINRRRSETGPCWPGDNSQNQRCLLDFTSSMNEPQRSRASKGRGIRTAEGVPLVNIATSNHSQYSNIYRSKSVKPDASRRAEGPFVRGGLISTIGSPEKRYHRKS